jgi:predicted ATP-dependent endonuclease of OLD family
MHALVGANNAGKSTVLLALDFLFNPSTKSLNAESFWNKDISLEIRVEAVFSELTDKEKEALNAYLKLDGTFHMARSAKIGTKSGDSDPDVEQGEDKIIISQHYKKPIPEPEWLQESKISSKNIIEWWKTKDKLLVNDISFAEGITKKPSVESYCQIWCMDNQAALLSDWPDTRIPSLKITPLMTSPRSS